MADTTDQPPPPKSLKRKHDDEDASGHRRALRACLPCRKRKVKCSGTRPCCENCLRLRDQCHWADDDPEPGALFKALHKPENVVNTEQRQILVDIFFSTPHLDIIRQSIHRPSFESSETGQQSPFLLVAIYSLSALYISDVDVRGTFNGEQAKAVSQRLALVAQHYSRDTSDQPTVPSIQANLILGFRELLCRTGLKSWMYTGLAIRMAQALRLGREYHQRHPAREQEVRRRTMWTCFIMDRLVSHITGRPQGIRTISLQQHLPCPESAFLFEEATEPQPTLEEGPNAESCEVFPYFIKAVELWGIMSDMFSKNVKGPPPTAPSDPQGSFYKAEQKFKSWIRSLPPRMQWSMKNHRTHKVLGQGSMFVSLHFVIHHALCVAHQEYLPQLEGDSQFPSSPFSDPSGIRDVVATCLHHANEITRMAFQPNDRSMLWSPFVGIALECAGCCHLWSIHLDPNAEIHDSSSQQLNFPIQPSKVAAKQKLCFLCGILKSWADIWPIAAAWKETIHLLGKFYDAFLPSNAPTMDGSFCPNPDDFGYQPPSSTDISLGSGLPDPRDPGLARRLIDKVRLIIMTALESSDLRHRQTRLWVENLWSRTLNQVQGGDSNGTGPEDIDRLLGFGEFSDFEDMLEFMGGSVDGYEDPSFTVAALDSIDQPYPVPFP